MIRRSVRWSGSSTARMTVPVVTKMLAAKEAAGRGRRSGVPLDHLYLAERMAEVPVLVIPCYDLPAAAARYGQLIGPERETLSMEPGMYASIYPAVWSFLLALRSRGLGIGADDGTPIGPGGDGRDPREFPSRGTRWRSCRSRTRPAGTSNPRAVHRSMAPSSGTDTRHEPERHRRASPIRDRDDRQGFRLLPRVAGGRRARRLRHDHHGRLAVVVGRPVRQHDGRSGDTPRRHASA